MDNDRIETLLLKLLEDMAVVKSRLDSIEEIKLDAKELANKVGISRQTIQRYESGVISNIPSDKIEKLAEALECSPAFLMGWDQKDQLNEKDKKSIDKDLNNIMQEFREGTDGTAYYNGVELEESDLDLIESAMKIALEQIKIKNKEKYTPKKYKK